MNRRVLLVSSTMMSGSNGPSKMIRMLNSEKAYLPFKLDVLTEDGDNTDAFSLKLRATRLLPQLGMFMRCVDYSWAAINLHRRNKFDVVVFNFAPFGLIFKMLTLRVPVVGFINDDTGVRYIRFTSAHQWIRSSALGFLDRLAARIFDLSIFNSKFLKQAYDQRLDCQNGIVLYKTHGVTRTKKMNPQKSRARFQVCFVKADYRTGNLQMLYDSLNRLNWSSELVVIGPKKRPSWLTDTSLVQVKFLGPLPNLIALEHIERAHAFCVPSWREALGVANMEAAMVGTPIIATRVGGIPEVLDDSSAWMCEPTLESLVSALEKCRHFPLQSELHAQEAYARVSSKFGKDTFIDNFSSMIQHLCPQ